MRTLEHDVAGLTASNPYSGNTNEKITNYLADPVEEGILHMVNADPARTPTFAMFAKPDYFLQSRARRPASGPCVTQNTGFAWDHGDYAAEIDTNWLGIAGPGVRPPRPGRLPGGRGPEFRGCRLRPGHRPGQRYSPEPGWI